MLSVLISGMLSDNDELTTYLMEHLIAFVHCSIICLLILFFCFQDGGTPKSDHTDVQLLHSCGEPKDEVRHQHQLILAS